MKTLWFRHNIIVINERGEKERCYATLKWSMHVTDDHFVGYVKFFTLAVLHFGVLSKHLLHRLSRVKRQLPK